jgi:hypothetical protein
MKDKMKLLIAVVLSALLAGCARTSVDGLGYVNRTSLPALAESSDVVAVAVVTGTSGTRNMARSIDDPRKPHPSLVSVGQDYVLSVREIMKGTVPATAVVSISMAIRTSQGDQQYPDFIPLQSGKTYLLFLKRQVDGTADFVPAPEPWRFVLSTVATAESPWSGAAQYFPTVPTEQLLAEVRSVSH